VSNCLDKRPVVCGTLSSTSRAGQLWLRPPDRRTSSAGAEICALESAATDGSRRAQVSYLALLVAITPWLYADPLFRDDTEGAGVAYLGCGKGVAMADVDRDGDLDIYAAIVYDADRLFLNSGPGRFSNVTRTSGVYGLTDTHGCVFADFNNDGNPDLFLAAMQEGFHSAKKYAAWGENKLYKGEGDGSFTDITVKAGLADPGPCTGTSVGDIDNDGDLDIVCATYDGGNCKLYINTRGTVFSEEAEKRGFMTGKAKFYGCNLADLDGDGWTDILLPRILGEGEPGIRYYHNDGDGTFTAMTREAGLAETGNACALALGDYDNDGDLDLFGSRSNRLFRNEGGNRFTDVSDHAGFHRAEGYARGCAFVDADNDGDLDLFIGGRRQFFRNNGNGTFTDVGEKWGLTVDLIHGCAFGDIDGDGDLDMYGTNWLSGSRPWRYPGKFVLYRNTTNSKAFLKVRLEGFRSNRGAIGAKVEIYRPGHLGDKRHLLGYREVICGYGAFSCHPLEQHFGLGRKKRCDLRVTFPRSRIVVDLKRVKRGQTVLVKEVAKGRHGEKITEDGRLFR